MTLVWSWEEMDHVGEEEPLLLPDLRIEPDDTCAYCGSTEETSGKRLAVECSQCGGVAHFHCAVDCAPWDTSKEYNDFVCGSCLEWTPADAAKWAASLTATEPPDDDTVGLWQMKSFDVPVDDDFDEALYPLP